MAEKAFWNKWASIKDEDKGRDNTEERSIFVDVGELPKTQRQFNLYHYFEFIRGVLEREGSETVLEIGCGRGTIGLYAAKHMGLDVSLLDNVPSALELAKEEFDRHGQTGTCYVEDVLKTNFPDNTFDAVVSIGLAEHFEEDEIDDLFKEELRILKPGGVMVSLNIPKKFSIQYLNILMRRAKKLFGAYKGDVKKDYYRNSFKPSDFVASAKRVGFVESKVTRVFPFPFFIPIKMSTDRMITRFFLFIVKIRRVFMKYPYKTNSLFAQSHFLVAKKSVKD